MSKFYKNILLTLLFSFLLCVSSVKAQEQTITQESVISFISQIKVNTDNSIYVNETIGYYTGAQYRHGIYRDIYPYSSTGKKMRIENISVTEGEATLTSPMFTVSSYGENVRIKIGDPNQTFTGTKVYHIEYHDTRAVAQYHDFDELYWNNTGNDWYIPI